MGTLVHQLWQCMKCGGVRIWGASVAHDVNVSPFLLCDTCKTHTEHIFVRHTYQNKTPS